MIEYAFLLIMIGISPNAEMTKKVAYYDDLEECLQKVERYEASMRELDTNNARFKLVCMYAPRKRFVRDESELPATLPPVDVDEVHKKRMENDLFPLPVEILE